MLHSADINPSEDDREKIIEFLEGVLRDTEAKEKELENLLKKTKQKMDADQIKDMEKEKLQYTRNAKVIEDAMSKCERTSGHTLKKAFNKKLIAAIRTVMGDEKYQALESVLVNNGLVHHHPVHHYGHHFAHEATPPVEAH